MAAQVESSDKSKRGRQVTLPYYDPLLAPSDPYPEYEQQERLLYVPVTIYNLTTGALLDSGCSDNFISHELSAKLGLTLYLLKNMFVMETVDGTHHPVTHYVRPVVRIGSAHIRLAMKVCKSKLAMILGYPFLRYFKVAADWGTRVITFHNDHQVHTRGG